MDPELFKRMQEAAERFRSGETDFEEIITPAGPAHLVRDESDPRGFRLDFVGEGSRRSVPLQEYPASSTRPPGYPAPLPFLAGCAAAVDTLAQSVTWSDPPEPESAFGRLVAGSLEEGWSPLAADPVEGGSPNRRIFEKDGVERTVTLGGDETGPRLEVRERRLP